MPVVVVGGAAAVVIAIMAILLILAAAQFGKALAAVMPTWHIPGLGSITGWITGMIGKGIAAQLAFLDQYAAPAVTFLTAPVIVLENMFDTVNRAFSGVYHALEHLAKVSLPYLLSVAVHDIAVAYGKLVYAIAVAKAAVLASLTYWVAVVRQEAAQLYAKALYAVALAESALRAELSYWVNALRAEAAQILAQARYAANAVEAVVTAKLAYWVNTLRAEAAAAISGLTGYVNTEINAVKAFATATAIQAANAAIGALNRIIAADLVSPWTQVAEGVQGLIDEADKDFTDVVDGLKKIDLSIPTDVVGAIAGVAAIAIPLLRLAKDCTMPNCRNLSQVGRDLQSIFGMVEGGAFIALLGAAASDPAGFAHDINSTIGTVVNDAVGIVRNEVGVS